MLRKMTIRLTGTRPLLMHNARLSDPLDPATKALAALTGQRKKSDEDHLEIARTEFLGSLYTNEDGRVIIPADNLHAMLGDGAKKFKQGPLVKSCVTVEDDVILEYKGPNDPNKLWENPAFRLRCQMRVQQNRVSRTRPCFRGWALTFELTYDADTIPDSDTIKRWIDMAGRMSGLGDSRPKYGRFTADVLSDVELNIGDDVVQYGTT